MTILVLVKVTQTRSNLYDLNYLVRPGVLAPIVGEDVNIVRNFDGRQDIIIPVYGKYRADVVMR
jgi:hypothetical protein